MTGIACAMRALTSAASEWRTVVTVGGFTNDFRHYSFYGGGDPGAIAQDTYKPNVIVRAVLCSATLSQIQIQIQRTSGGALPQNFFRSLSLELSSGAYKHLETASADSFGTFTGAGAGFPAERWTWNVTANAANMWFGASDAIGVSRTIILTS
jgi:hypothetical protein